MEVTKHKLAKWSRMVRIRDGHTCFLCEEDSTKVSSTLSRRQMHSHHIDMLSLYPYKALDLSNGICLCSRCHLEITHTNNPSSPKKMRALYVRYNKLKAVREFNAKWQHKLDDRQKP